jgi:hypothetical protein
MSKYLPNDTEQRLKSLCTGAIEKSAGWIACFHFHPAARDFANAMVGVTLTW